MARRLLLVTYTPRIAPGGEEEYARWIRERDYPAFRQSPLVHEYSCFRIARGVQGEEECGYLDLIFVADGVEHADLRRDEAIARHARGYHERWFETPGPHNMTVSVAEEIWG